MVKNGMSSRLRTGLVVILDGFGIAPEGPGNAVALARTPRWDSLIKKYPYAELHAAGPFVGLPDGVAGNSEVGHLSLGAGRPVDQDLLRIQKALGRKALDTSPQWKEFLASAQAKSGSQVHLVGLISDGFVHSSLEQLMEMLLAFKAAGLRNLVLHAITDGRDSLPTASRAALAKVVRWLDEMGVGTVGTVCGRFYAMDRDKRWDRTEKAFRVMVQGDSEFVFSDPVRYCEESYEKRFTDEFVPPARSRSFRGIVDGDLVFFFNYRADRMRQITQAFLSSEFSHFSRKELPALKAALTLTDYDESLACPTLFPKEKVAKTLGEILSGHGPQLRIAETEKYAHVTYFFSGGREEPFAGERRILVPSNRDVRTYDERPEMSAAQITESALEALQKDKPVLGVINFANPDMIAHTGNLAATIRAVEAVDKCLGRIVDWVEANNAFAIITSDHGNAEQMISSEGGPLPCHTMSLVPCVVVDSTVKNMPLRSGSITDVAPTFLELQGLAVPKEMTSTSLLQR
jgi:2,3-bisphosphoglycerate-independent phosphoglycerate mutase